MENILFCTPSEFKNEDFKTTSAIGKEVFFANENLNDDEIGRFDIFILSCPEIRGYSSAKLPTDCSNILRELYLLKSPENPKKIADLGTIKEGQSLEDTFFAIKTIAKKLVEHNKVLILVGGAIHLTYANYLAFSELQKSTNLVCIDKALCIGNQEGECTTDNYVSHLIMHQPNYLFNYANLGYQTYFTAQKELELVNKLYFEAMRLGELRADIKEVEPMMRNADIVSINLAALKNADAPATFGITPNGLYSEEACQLARYAGIGDRLTVFGLFGYNSEADFSGQTAQLSAQILWYFMEGVSQRRNDYPIQNSKLYLKYLVSLEESERELVFYKSLKTDRWWIDLPLAAEKSERFLSQRLIPCSYNDYRAACANDIPEKWWKANQKVLTS